MPYHPAEISNPMANQPMTQQGMGLMGISPQNQGLLTAAAQLLEGGGPSLTPTSLGQNLGRATMAGMNSYNQGRQQALQNALMKRKLAREDQLGQAASRYFQGDPALAEIAAVDPELAARLSTGISQGDPSAVREWQYYNSLSPEDQRRYLNMKRARQIEEIGGGIVDVTSAGEEETLSTAEQERQAAEERKAAEARGTASGKEEVNIQGQLADLDTTASQIERVLADPDFDEAVGPVNQFTGRVGEAMGTDVGVLGSEVERIANRLTREAAATWKGAISEKELELFARSVPSRGSPAPVWRAWYKNEYLPLREKAERKLRQVSGEEQPQSEGPRRSQATLRYNPETGQVEPYGG